MIKGVHAMFNTPQAEELRMFLRDKLQLPFFDAGDSWLIFHVPEVEVGCHPAHTTSHDISFYCDDLEETVADLKRRGVEFVGDIEDHGYGFTTNFKAPGDLTLQLYQAKYK